MESILSIIMLVISFLNVGEPATYKVIAVNNHNVIVQAVDGNQYTYYQDIVTVSKNDQVIDIDGQLLVAEDNNSYNMDKNEIRIFQNDKNKRAEIVTYDFIVYIPYTLGQQ